MWDSRPAILTSHHDLTRLGMSLASTTGYEGPGYKIPMTLSKDEFEVSGDPEPRFAGFGPFLFPALVAAIVTLATFAFRRPHRLNSSFLLFALAAGVLLPTVTMPQSWLARCIPQFWLFPLLVGAAATPRPAACRDVRQVPYVFFETGPLQYPLRNGANMLIAGATAVFACGSTQAVAAVQPASMLQKHIPHICYAQRHQHDQS
jgi:hypothetical protein